MAKYSDIKGFTVQTVSSDPVASQALGGTWSSGNNMNTGREELGGTGIQTAGLAISGQLPGSFSPRTRQEVESYNGTSWTEVAEVNTGRSLAANGGTYTSAVFASGYSQDSPADKRNNAETWNGSSWTEVAEVNTARFGLAGAGTSNTAAIAFGGTNPASDPPEQALNESWNGSSWTEVGDMNVRKRDLAGGGTATAALAFGGRTNPSSTISADAESWNGSSWTEISSMNTGRYWLAGGVSSVTDALAFGGYEPPTNSGKTEAWNGTTWTELSDLATGRRAIGGANQAPSVAALAFGGIDSSAISNSTEEFTAPSVFSKITEGQLFFNSTANAFKETISDFSGAAWASGGDTNHQDTERGGSAGQSNGEGLIFGGGTPPAPIQATAEQYDGTSWTEIAALNTGRQGIKGSVNSPYTSAIAFGGASPGTNPSGSNLNESWNGSAWTEIAELNTATKFHGGSGTTNDALKISGQTAPGSALANVEKWNGSAWTEIAEVNQTRLELMATGGSTSAIATGGAFYGGTPPNAARDNVETWDGTSWTETTEMSTVRKNQHGCAGSNAVDALVYGGDIQPGLTANTEKWNGSSWTELANLGTARAIIGPGGTSSSAFAARGTTPSAVNSTEEWTVNLANKTITAS